MEADASAWPVETEALPPGWSTACPDWADRILARRSLIPTLPLFDAEAEKALRIFKRLRVPDIIGTPSHGEACDQWVFDLVRVIFGSYCPELKRRLIREFFLLIPKKNGKSSIAAAIIVTAAIVNRRPTAELLLIAPTKKIADTAFKQAAGIIRLDSELSKVFHLQQHQRTITHRVTEAQIIVKAADADVITGSKATYILIDETHVFAQKSNAADVFVEIRGSLAARKDGFLLQITTQSKAPPAGVFKSELSIARAVRDGEMTLPLLPILYELPQDMAKDDGWQRPELWGLVNPNLNRSVDANFLRDELLKAQREGPQQMALLASQHFNVEVGMALKTDHWAGARYWPTAADPTITLASLLERCDVAAVGIDGGGLDDLLGLCVAGREKVTRDWLFWFHAWCQDDVLELRKEIAPTLQDFARLGQLTLCETPTQDLVEIADIVSQVAASGLLPEEGGIGLDPVCVAALVDALAERQIDGKQLVAIPQGYKLNGAILGLERKLKDGTAWHAGQELMTWCVGNAKVEQRGNAVLVTKQAAGKAKIDPLCAGFNAAQILARNPQAAPRREYQMIFV